MMGSMTTQQERSRKHYEANRDQIIARANTARKAAIRRNAQYVTEQKGRPCMDCDGSYPPVAMDFDHVRGEKRGNVADLVKRAVSLATIQEEIDKCDLVCANCHRIRTASRKLNSWV